MLAAGNYPELYKYTNVRQMLNSRCESWQTWVPKEADLASLFTVKSAGTNLANRAALADEIKMQVTDHTSEMGDVLHRALAYEMRQPGSVVRALETMIEISNDNRDLVKHTIATENRAHQDQALNWMQLERMWLLSQASTRFFLYVKKCIQQTEDPEHHGNFGGEAKTPYHMDEDDEQKEINFIV